MSEVRSIKELLPIKRAIVWSDHFEVFYCDHCPNVHLVMFDENDVPAAQMTLAPGNLDLIIEGAEQVFKRTGYRWKR